MTRKLRWGVTPEIFEQAMGEVAGVVGAEWVFTDVAAGLAGYRDAYRILVAEQTAASGLPVVPWRLASAAERGRPL